MSIHRSDRDWAVLKNEFKICKKKLESKNEGIKILMKDLEHYQMERDIYKNKVCQLQQELDELKELVGDNWKDNIKNGSLFSCEENSDKKIKTLSQLIKHIRKDNQALQNDLASVKKLYVEAQQDNEMLRESLHQFESKRKESSCDASEKMRLIEQLEDAQNKIEEMKEDFDNLTEQKNEIEQQRDHFRESSIRLNLQLNYALHNDDRRIFDIDALVLENQYLKEVSKQFKTEKAMMADSMTRYKEALDRRFNKASRLLSYLDVPVSFTQKAFGGHGSPVKVEKSETFNELQRLTTSLTESLTDKDTALRIQRKTNRVLGMRVRELEKKLKTLEISGLWAVQDHKGGMIAAADLQKESKENEGACGATDTQDNRSEGDPENDFEDSSWDPYCEIGGDLGMTQSSLIDTLIDVSVCQTNQNNNIGSGLTSSTGS